MTLVSAIRALRAMCLGIWLGGIIMTFVAAPIIFSKLEPDRARAGMIVGEILHVAGVLKMGLALIALACDGVLLFGPVGSVIAKDTAENVQSFGFFRRVFQYARIHGSENPSRGWRRYAPVGFLAAALLSSFFAIFWLEPKIIELRDRIGEFTPATAGSPDRVAFRNLHGASMGLLLAEAVFVGISFLLGML